MFKNIRYLVNSVAESNIIRINGVNRRILAQNSICGSFYRSKKTDPSNLSSLFKPVPFKLTQDDSNVGAELTGANVDKAEMMKILNRFTQRPEVRMLCFEHGLDGM